MQAERQEPDHEAWSERLFDFVLATLGMVILLSPLALWISWSETVFYIVLGTGLGAMAAVALLVTLFPERRRRWLPTAAPPAPRPAPQKPLTPGQEFGQLVLVIVLLLAVGIGVFVTLWAIF